MSDLRFSLLQSFFFADTDDEKSSQSQRTDGRWSLLSYPARHYLSFTRETNNVEFVWDWSLLIPMTMTPRPWSSSYSQTAQATNRESSDILRVAKVGVLIRTCFTWVDAREYASFSDSDRNLSNVRHPIDLCVILTFHTVSFPLCPSSRITRVPELSRRRLVISTTKIVDSMTLRPLQ